MGIPFPAGLSALAGDDKGRIAWAWAVNGSSSVAFTSVAMILAMEIGLAWVLILSALLYLLALFSCRIIAAFS